MLWTTVGSAQAQDLNALFSSSSTLINSTSEGTTTDLKSFTQTLDLNWNKTISPTLRYRLTLRGEDDRNQTQVGSDLTRSSTTQYEPILDATLSSSAFSLNAGYRLKGQYTDGSEQAGIWLNERRWFTRFFLTPQDLPRFTFQVDRFTKENNEHPQSINETDTRYQLGTNYDYGGATFSYLFSDHLNDNLVVGQNRDQKVNTANLGYTGTSLWGWLDVLAGYSINYSTTHEEFSKSGVAEVEQPLSRGLKAAADFTPLDSSDVPLINDPGLISGGASVPLDLNISIGFEQLSQPPKPVSQIRINLMAVPPFIIPNNLQTFLKLRVFVTDKADPNSINAWVEIGGYSQNWNSLEGRFELTWPSSPTPPPTARFVKVWVDANPFGASIQATKITALNLEAVTGGTKRDQNTLANNVNGSFTIRPPMRPWTISAISYDFSLSHIMEQPGAIRNISGTQTARLVAEPYKYVTSTFTYQHNFSDTNQEGSKQTTADLSSVVFTFAPLPTLTNSLTYAHNDNRGDGKLEQRTDTGSLNASARLYRNLNVDATYSLSKSQDFLIDQKTLTQGGSINANATLTQRLNATLGYSLNWSQTEKPDENTSQLTHTLNGSFTYTISRLLNFNVRYDFLTGNDVTSFTQDYRVDWSPTAKLSGFVDYRRTQQQSGGERTSSDAVGVNGRWNLSRYLNFDANFLFFNNSDGNKVFGFSGRVQLRF
ncbi:MAG: hypothetical protein ACM3TN_07000 [Alphaproteobacteria bacterium]